MTVSKIESAARECFADNKAVVHVSIFIKALQRRNVDTHKKITKIVESTSYLFLTDNNNFLALKRDKWGTLAKPALAVLPPLSRLPVPPTTNATAKAGVVPPHPHPPHANNAIVNALQVSQASSSLYSTTVVQSLEEDPRPQPPQSRPQPRQSPP